MNFKKILTLIIAVVMVCTFMTSCGNNTKSFLSAVDKMENEKAVGLVPKLAPELEKDAKKMAEYVASAGEMADLAVAGFINGELTYEQAYNKLKLMNAVTYMSKVDDAMDDIDTINYSKERYEEGVNELNEKNYVYAARCFNDVSEIDTARYATAQQQAKAAMDTYLNEAIALSNDYVSKGEYSEAKDAIWDVYYDFDDRTALDAQIKAIDDAKQAGIIADAKKKATEEAAKLAKEGDFEGAMSEVKAFIDEYSVQDSEVDTLYNSYKDQYVAFISAKVEALMAETKYIGALRMLDNAEKVVEAEKFTQLRDSITAVKPTYLADVKYQLSNGFGEVTEGNDLMDTIGNTYKLSDGNIFRITGGWSEGYADFYLGYKYTMIHGFVAVDDKSDPVEGTLTFEGDGNVLYTLQLSRLTPPAPIDINIGNVNVLKIRFKSADHWDDIHAILNGFYFDK